MNRNDAKVLLQFVPEHSRTSCSDENPGNGYTTPGRRGAPRCVRCALLKASILESYAVDLQVDVDVRLPNADPGSDNPLVDYLLNRAS